MAGFFRVTTSLHQALSNRLRNSTHRTLDDILWFLDLELGEGSKAERVHQALEGLGVAELCTAAEKYLSRHFDWELEEALFLQQEQSDSNKLSIITRREIARCFDESGLGICGESPLLDFLAHEWPLDSGLESIEEAFGLPSTGLKSQIRQHMIRNSDWSVEYLLEQLGAMECSSRRFQRMIQRSVHPESRRAEAASQLIECMSAHLSRDGLTFRECGQVSGYPVFEIVRLRTGVAGRPKNIIFAANGPKPEIGFSDAINNDIVILRHSENCLVYDQPISSGGILWEDLVKWWQATARCESIADARKSLGVRLHESLQSEGEKNFFRQYFRHLRPLLKSKLPALIPQVYLHYDPATARTLLERRQGRRLPRQRMDFLLLLPEHRRIVIEIDGQHHFCDESNRPSLTKYSEMMSADRELRLSGYELYRFGANEVCGGGAEERISRFLSRLLTPM